MSKLGLGATFKLHNGTSLTSMGEVTSIKPPTPKGSVVEDTHHGNSDGIRTYKPGLLDPGELEVKGWCMAGDATYDLGVSSIGLSRAFEAVIPGDSGGATDALKYAGNCIVLEFDVGTVTPGELIEYTLKAQVSGAITESAV